MDLVADEYTALQKYISTYRDPKAADSPENQAKDGADAKKGKAWWQASSHHTPTLTRLLT